MDAVSDPERPLPGAPERLATRVAFFISGFGTAAWAPLVPFAKERLGTDDGTLGLLLLCLGAGSSIAMPLSGGLAARFGCRRVIWAGCLGISVSLPLLGFAPTGASLALALLLFGAGIGAADVAMNIQAVIVEKTGGRTMMSGFHGLYSVGGIAGAGGVSGLLWVGASPMAAGLGIGVAILGLMLAFGRHLLPYGREGDAPAFALPHGVVLFIGCLCFITFLTEGSMLDWSALFLTSLRGVDPAHSGLGYAAFALVMTLGRLTGDRVVHLFGGRTILIFGSLCAASGLILAVSVPSWIAAIVGFSMVGLGASNIVPVLYSTAGRQQVMAPNLAIAAITTFGYLGILAGPALIGFIARAASLSTAFVCVAALLIVVAGGARVATR